MIKKNLFKTMTLIVLCTMVFAGCGRKKVTVDTSIQQESRAGDSKDDKKKVASNQEQVTVAVKDADGNTVEVAGIVETKDNGEKVVVVTDSEGNRTEISAGGFTTEENKTVTVTDEKASEAISSARQRIRYQRLMKLLKFLIMEITIMAVVMTVVMEALEILTATALHLVAITVEAAVMAAVRATTAVTTMAVIITIIITMVAITVAQFGQQRQHNNSRHSFSHSQLEACVWLSNTPQGCNS